MLTAPHSNYELWLRSEQPLNRTQKLKRQDPYWAVIWDSIGVQVEAGESLDECWNEDAILDERSVYREPDCPRSFASSPHNAQLIRLLQISIKQTFAYGNL